MKTFKSWILETYDLDQLKDISEHGCSGGVCGLIYYTETTAFYNEHHDEIWQQLWRDHQDLGYSTPLDMVASFNGAKDVNSHEQFKNLLVWYYVEEIAREYLIELEEQNEG